MNDKNEEVNKDFKFIQEFSKITMTSVCKKLDLNRSYIMSGKASPEIYSLVRKQINIEIEKANLK